MPASLLTNHPGDARDFSRSGDGVVYKATMHKLIYTTPVDPATIDGRVSTTMHLFQANVPKTHDVRVVVTGDRSVHAVAIRTDDPAVSRRFPSTRPPSTPGPARSAGTRFTLLDCRC